MRDERSERGEIARQFLAAIRARLRQPALYASDCLADRDLSAFLSTMLFTAWTHQLNDAYFAGSISSELRRCTFLSLQQVEKADEEPQQHRLEFYPRHHCALR